jgi:hypothetical protein
VCFSVKEKQGSGGGSPRRGEKESPAQRNPFSDFVLGFFSEFLRRDSRIGIARNLSPLTA